MVNESVVSLMDVDFLRVGAHLELRPYIICKGWKAPALKPRDHLGLVQLAFNKQGKNHLI